MARHALPGLRAVRRVDARHLRNGRLARGSLCLEAATLELWRSSVKHWDYVVAFDDRTNSRAVAVEVHSATSDAEVPVVIDKKNTAVRALVQELRSLRVCGWYWIAPGGRCSFRPGSRFQRLLWEADIEGPRSGLDLEGALRLAI